MSEKCFCKSNWPKLKASLDKEVIEACNKYQAEKKTVALDCDPETGVIKNCVSTNSNGSKSQEI